MQRSSDPGVIAPLGDLLNEKILPKDVKIHPFYERLGWQTLKIDEQVIQTNELKFNDGKLTGLANEVIVGARSKADFLRSICRELDILPDRAVAIGDGANDLKMMQLAGLSVAYHAKPAVQQQAATALNYCGLDGVLGLLDIDSA